MENRKTESGETTVLSRICDELGNLNQQTGDEFDVFGVFMATTLRKIAGYDRRLADLTQAELRDRLSMQKTFLMNGNRNNMVRGMRRFRPYRVMRGAARNFIDDGRRKLVVLMKLLLVLLIDDDNEDMSDARDGKEDVNDAHVPFVETRFHIFDAYLASLNPSSYHEFMRMYPEEFEELHHHLYPKLVHAATHLEPIGARHRLAIFLRYVGHGGTRTQISGEFEIGSSTASKIVREVAAAIIDVLHATAFPRPTRSTWMAALSGFKRSMNYPAAIGALDGKHIACVRPSGSGSTYYNNKGFYSIVLLAIVDADYRCIIYDLGATGCLSDAEVFSRSAMKAYLEAHDGDFPEPQQLPDIGKVPCHFLVDQGFRQTVRFIRPYSQPEASKEIKCAHFNLVHSRARRVVENYFGILANRFRILMRPMTGPPAVVETITLAIMVLHNLMIISVGAEAVVQRFGLGEPFQDAEELGVSGNVPYSSKAARNALREYFARREGLH